MPVCRQMDYAASSLPQCSAEPGKDTGTKDVWGLQTYLSSCNGEKILGGCTEVGCRGHSQVQRVPRFFRGKIFLLPLIYMIRFNYQGRSTNENHDGCLFCRAASWTPLHAKEEGGPRCAATSVKVLSPMQQPVAILGVNLEFLIHIWVAFIILSPS